MKIRLDQNRLILDLPRKIDYQLPSSYKQFIEYSQTGVFQILDLNFKETKFVSLPGAMYLLFFVSSLINAKNKSKLHIETIITNYSESILNVIINFGLIDMLKSQGNLLGNNYTNELNNEKMKFWKKDIKHLQRELNNIYWPITIIPQKSNFSFETDLSTYINNFSTYFNIATESNLIGSTDDNDLEFKKKYFISAINEATKNVWDHSESWGAAAIYSGQKAKTTLCLFDYGIGFINSFIKRKGEYLRNTKADMETLEWLFVEGNTSNENDNFGRGLARIAKFTNISKGILLIRTDKYILQYSSKKGLLITESEYFPGSQLMINF